MSDKTFRQRIQEEVTNFPKIYADFKDDLKARSEEGLVESNWLHLFGVPFNGYVLDEQPNDEARRILKVPHKHDAVKSAIHELGVHELRLGALEIKDSRVIAALELGLLTPDDLVPPSSKHPGELERLAHRYRPDHGDPIFWRTLLEVFCRAFIASRGRKPWPLAQTIELAFDMDEIRCSLPAGIWNEQAVKRSLNEKEPYITKYPASDSASGLAGVGTDRIKAIVDLIGPMNNDALKRLRDLFPDAFFKVADTRQHREQLQKYGLMGLLNQAEDAGDVLSKSTPPSDPHANGKD